MPGFDIDRKQQKIFIENFMSQVLDLALQLVDQGRDKDSPGATIDAVGRGVIQQLYRMRAMVDGDGREDA